MKEILKYSIWSLLWASLIVPFVVFNSMFFPYITGKAVVFRIIIELAFGLWLILIIKDKEYRPRFSWIMASTGIFTLVLLVADINAVAPFKAFWSNFERMEGWVTIIHLLMYFCVIGSMFKTVTSWRWFFQTGTVAGLIMAVTSIDQASGVRFSGPLGNPIYISVYFLFLLFFTLILLYKDVLAKNLETWSEFKKVFSSPLSYFYLVSSIVSFYVIYRTSRGVLLGAGMGVLLSAILVLAFEKHKKVIRHLAVGIITLGVLVVVVFFGVRQTEFVKNNPTLSRFATMSWSNVSGQARQYVWPMAIEGFKEKPILGWGQEGFNYVFNKYYDPRMYGQEAWFDRAHNAPLDFLVAGGILGLLSYLALFGSALYLLWFRKNNLDIAERAIITGLILGYLFQALFVFDNLVSYMMFFLTLAYIHSQAVNDMVIKNKTRPLDSFLSNVEYQNYILIPLVVIITTVGVWWVSIPVISDNQALISALRAIQQNQIPTSLMIFKNILASEPDSIIKKVWHLSSRVGDSEAREQLLSYGPPIARIDQIDSQTKSFFLNYVFTEVERQISLVPDDARYYILMGSFLNGIGSYDKALPYIEQAVVLSPKKQAMRFQLVQSLYAVGKIDEAITEAKSAYELDTSFIDAEALYKAILAKKTEK